MLIEDRLVRPEDGGFAALARSGMYMALRARGALVGLVALEDVAPDVYGKEQHDLMESLSSLLALSIDNARWFGRLRTLGAEAERARIARELHDRVAQSLAYVAFELERMQGIPGEKVARDRRAARGRTRHRARAPGDDLPAPFERERERGHRVGGRRLPPAIRHAHRHHHPLDPGRLGAAARTGSSRSSGASARKRS